ncbi:MAG: hypothetical protein KBD60_11160 [Sterolibacterium sp.]|jgi:hypothetical protein|nr:hypothetical protein [Sterolibacterium sp.]
MIRFTPNPAYSPRQSPPIGKTSGAPPLFDHISRHRDRDFTKSVIVSGKLNRYSCGIILSVTMTMKSSVMFGEIRSGLHRGEKSFKKLRGYADLKIRINSLRLVAQQPKKAA